MEIEDLEKWTVPKWHPDFGDAKVEFDMLKEFSSELLRRNQNYSLKLDCYEEGYMSVDIFSEDNKYAELHVVDRDSGKAYGLFLMGKSDDEIYFTDLNEGLKYF